MNIYLTDLPDESLAYLELALDITICRRPIGTKSERLEAAMCRVQLERMRREAVATRPTFCVVQ